MSDAQAEAERTRRRVRLAWLVVGAYLVGLGVAAALRTQGDFNVYYRAGTRVLHGEALYRLDESSHFLYAPIFAIAFAPLAALPLKPAQFAFYLLSAISILAMIRGSARMLFRRNFELTAELILVPLILSVHLVNNNIEHGQINLPTLALTIWAIVYAEKDCAMWSGAMLATAVLIKPFAALGGLFLLLERKWRAIGYAIVTGVILLLAPVALWGPRGALEETVSYLTVVHSMTDRYTLMLTNQSATSAIARILSLMPSTEASANHLGLVIGTAI
ncbi:MAG TPA: glycosyltransferase family 87 protein, partial [Candidatus Binataceae bacterium]|nr:glycosyltransferase family 87 protein [Candidatus Binataceae bacterium]